MAKQLHELIGLGTYRRAKFQLIEIYQYRPVEILCFCFK